MEAIIDGSPWGGAVTGALASLTLLGGIAHAAPAPMVLQASGAPRSQARPLSDQALLALVACQLIIAPALGVSPATPDLAGQRDQA